VPSGCLLNPLLYNSGTTFNVRIYG